MGEVIQFKPKPRFSLQEVYGFILLKPFRTDGFKPGHFLKDLISDSDGLVLSEDTFLYWCSQYSLGMDASGAIYKVLKENGVFEFKN
jgi:hypothetical protein